MVDQNVLAMMRQQQHDLNDKKIFAHVNDYDVEMKSDIFYIEDGRSEHLLDIYSPKDNKDTKLPVVVMIHGGGYASGYKELDRMTGQYIAKAGFHVVNINYTLMPEVGFKTELQEAFTVFNWIKDNSEKYKFDATKVSVMGDSSGGHYVLLIAAVQNNKELQKYYEVKPYEFGLKGCVSICPSAFEAAIHGTGEINENIVKVLGDWFEDKEYVEKCSYQYFMDKNYPEVMIVTTPTDSILAKEHIKLHEFMEKNDIKHVYKSYESKENKLDHVFNVLFPEYEESIRANNDIVSYLKDIIN